jgi:hypothetical protein
MAIPNDYREIVHKLLSRTDQGEVKWSKTFHASTFEVQISPGTKFQIWSGFDENTDLGFVAFSLNTLDGERLDNWTVDDGENGYDFMIKLYQTAKRSAHNVGETLDGILARLNEASPIGRS